MDFVLMIEKYHLRLSMNINFGFATYCKGKYEMCLSNYTIGTYNPPKTII